MPSANTDLVAMLAGDSTLCVRRASSNMAQQATAPQPSAADANLARLIEAWPALSNESRAAIVALVDEATVNKK
jgi:hypothetical protein